MKIVENAKTLINLYKDYRTMDKTDLADFYKSKCTYYQDHSPHKAGCLSSMDYAIHLECRWFSVPQL